MPSSISSSSPRPSPSRQTGKPRRYYPANVSVRSTLVPFVLKVSETLSTIVSVPVPLPGGQRQYPVVTDGERNNLIRSARSCGEHALLLQGRRTDFQIRVVKIVIHVPLPRRIGCSDEGREGITQRYAGYDKGVFGLVLGVLDRERVGERRSGARSRVRDRDRDRVVHADGGVLRNGAR